MYKLTDDPDVVVRLRDKTFIANGHRWWDEYQEFLSGGGVPDPARTAEEEAARLAEEGKREALEADAEAAKDDGKLQVLASMTPAQARAWVATNVTSLAEAKDLLGTMAALLTVLARRVLGL